MTHVLAIATSTPQVSVALRGPAGPVGHLALQAGRRHGESLAPAIQSLVRMAGVDLRSLDRIAVDTGPGLFTGLRVGVATAKALGSALDVAVVACSSLDLLAHPHRHLRRPVASVVDARRGEVFWARYEPVDGGMAAVTDAAVAAPDVLAVDPLRFRVCSSPATAPAGTSPAAYWADWTNRGDCTGWTSPPPEYDHPSAVVLAELAPTRAALPAEKISATYLRGADVRIGWEQR